MGCGIDLSSLSLGDIAQSPLRKHFSLSAQHLCDLGKTLFQGLGLFETATLLHALLHSVGGAGAQHAFSSPINTMDRAVITKPTRPCRLGLSGSRRHQVIVSVLNELTAILGD
jgi:hypothetical protein